MCILLLVRTNIDIDDDLLAEARRSAGTVTKRETVEVALRELARRRSRLATRELKGTVDWDGDLKRSRSER